MKHYIRAAPRLVWMSIALALCINSLGLLFIFTNYNKDAMVAGDGLIYEELAQNIDKGLGFVLLRNDEYVQETFRTPGLPTLLVVFYKLGLGIKSYFVALSFLSSVLVPLLGWYVAKTLFNRKVGEVTALLLVLEPLVWLHNWSFITEVPFLIVSLLGYSLLIRACKKQSACSYEALFSGILFAGAIYIRPALFPILILGLFVVFVERSFYLKKIAYQFVFVFFILFVCLLPWYSHMHQVTGVYALSGTGWRNVYTDYLASIRAINNNTNFLVEKEALKLYAMERWGLERMEINSPSQSAVFKAYAIPEIWDNKETVIKLQSLLFISYFTHTDYQRKLQKLGMLPMNKVEAGRVSSTRLVIEKGIFAVPDIYKEMKNRYFMPIIERVWAGSLLSFAILGFFVTKSRTRYLVLLLMALGYLTSSAIGLGIEGRLRVPLLPFYFMLASCGILFILQFLKGRINVWKK